VAVPAGGRGATDGALLPTAVVGRVGSDPPPFPYGIDEQRLVVAPSVVPAEAVEVVAVTRDGVVFDLGRGAGVGGAAAVATAVASSVERIGKADLGPLHRRHGVPAASGFLALARVRLRPIRTTNNNLAMMEYLSLSRYWGFRRT